MQRAMLWSKTTKDKCLLWTAFFSASSLKRVPGQAFNEALTELIFHNGGRQNPSRTEQDTFLNRVSSDAARAGVVGAEVAMPAGKNQNR